MEQPQVALVLSGGGARAAYQVGFIHRMIRDFPELRFHILCGTSAGAINVAQLACGEGELSARIARLVELWRELRTEEVFRTHLGSLAWHVLSWTLRLASGGSSQGLGARGLVDTAPLRAYLARGLQVPRGPFPRIQERLDGGEFSGVAISAVQYQGGRNVTWFQCASDRSPAPWVRPTRMGICTRLTLDHVMASSALPLFFPAVPVDGAWFGDGGLRLTAPLAPAVHLGATHILALSIHYQPPVGGYSLPPQSPYPQPVEILGTILNSIFLDQFDADALQLGRLNRLIDLVPPERRADLRPIQLLLVRPSADLGHIANEFEPRLPLPLRFLTRGLGTARARDNDALSLVMFQSDYLERLMELGEHDAAARLKELRVLLPR